MTTILGSNVTTIAQLDNLIAQANAQTTSGTYEIDLGANASIALTQALTAISLHSGVTLDIEGNGATINGQNSQQGLFVNSGNVTIENLTIANALAQGAAGAAGGGGGGAGLGGGLFIGATAHVAITNVSFSGDQAVGGTGGGGAAAKTAAGAGSSGQPGGNGATGQQAGGGGVGGIGGSGGSGGRGGAAGSGGTAGAGGSGATFHGGSAAGQVRTAASAVAAAAAQAAQPD